MDNFDKEEMLKKLISYLNDALSKECSRGKRKIYTSVLRKAKKTMHIDDWAKIVRMSFLLDAIHLKSNPEIYHLLVEFDMKVKREATRENRWWRRIGRYLKGNKDEFRLKEFDKKKSVLEILECAKKEYGKDSYEYRGVSERIERILKTDDWCEIGNSLFGLFAVRELEYTAETYELIMEFMFNVRERCTLRFRIKHKWNSFFEKGAKRG